MNTQWRQTAEQTVDGWMKNSPLCGLSQNAKTFLVSALQKLDVVTREEYEIQMALLAHTREKLEALERQVNELEQAQNSR